jgi:hypothetical protein
MFKVGIYPSEPALKTNENLEMLASTPLELNPLD